MGVTRSMSTAACHAQGVDAIAVLGRDMESRVGAPLGIGASNCIHFRQYITACPTGTLFDCLSFYSGA